MARRAEDRVVNNIFWRNGAGMYPDPSGPAQSTIEHNLLAENARHDVGPGAGRGAETMSGSDPPRARIAC